MIDATVADGVSRLWRIAISDVGNNVKIRFWKIFNFLELIEETATQYETCYAQNNEESRKNPENEAVVVSTDVEGEQKKTTDEED